MDKVLNIGDEVLIFRYICEWGINQDYECFIKGIVVKSEMSDDLSYHGSPRYVMNYYVLGEDGREYFGNYKKPTLGDSFFMTRWDYIDYLENEMAINYKEILEINEKNRKIQEMIENVQIKESKREINPLVKKKICN